MKRSPPYCSSPARAAVMTDAEAGDDVAALEALAASIACANLRDDVLANVLPPTTSAASSSSEFLDARDEILSPSPSPSRATPPRRSPRVASSGYGRGDGVASLISGGGASTPGGAKRTTPRRTMSGELGGSTPERAVIIPASPTRSSPASATPGKKDAPQRWAEIAAAADEDADEFHTAPSTPMPQSVSRANSTRRTAFESALLEAEQAEEDASKKPSPAPRPKLVVRFKREVVNPAQSPEARASADAAVTATPTDGEPPPRTSPLAAAAPKLATRDAAAGAAAGATGPAAAAADRPFPTPERRPRSKLPKKKPSRQRSAFATFRDAKRQEKKEVAASTDDAVDALAAAFEKTVSLSVASPPAGSTRRASAFAARAPRSMRDENVGVVGLSFSDVMELHEGPPAHFERPARHAAVVAKFFKEGLEGRCERVPARLATDDELLLCHSQSHLDAVESTFDASKDEAVQGEGDIYWTTHTARCARTAAGSAAAVAAAVAAGSIHRGFAVVRPPGHHAECARAMGFCFYNNAAIAARVALRQPGVERVLVLDWDVHHGNGIQDVLYDDPKVMYASLHRHGNGFYPGTGDIDECGIREGVGYNVNIPWAEKGLGDADYLAAFDLVIDPIARAFNPDVVVVAAGFDAAEGDPLGGMKVSDQGYALMTERLLAHAKGRCVCALEGGYGLRRVLCHTDPHTTPSAR